MDSPSSKCTFHAFLLFRCSLTLDVSATQKKIVSLIEVEILRSISKEYKAKLLDGECFSRSLSLASHTRTGIVYLDLDVGLLSCGYRLRSLLMLINSQGDLEIESPQLLPIKNRQYWMNEQNVDVTP